MGQFSLTFTIGKRRRDAREVIVGEEKNKKYGGRLKVNHTCQYSLSLILRQNSGRWVTRLSIILGVKSEIPQSNETAYCFTAPLRHFSGPGGEKWKLFCEVRIVLTNPVHPSL